jgi:hypothetical protein
LCSTTPARIEQVLFPAPMYCLSLLHVSFVFLNQPVFSTCISSSVTVGVWSLWYVGVSGRSLLNFEKSVLVRLVPCVPSVRWRVWPCIFNDTRRRRSNPIYTTSAKLPRYGSRTARQISLIIGPIFLDKGRVASFGRYDPGVP